MLFPNYRETNMVYHIASITDLNKILEDGIKYDDKHSYMEKYYNFHSFIDDYRPEGIPSWVERKKAIFASLNYTKSHKWHSHTAIIGINVNPKKCWFANENLVNEFYEPFILSNIEKYRYLKNYIMTQGKSNVEEYWKTSMSLDKFITEKIDCGKNYDGEILIFHDIEPSDLRLMAIISDHKFIRTNKIKNVYKT